MIDYRVAVEIPPDNLQFAKEISRANIAVIVFQKYRKVNPNPQKTKANPASTLICASMADFSLAMSGFLRIIGLPFAIFRLNGNLSNTR